MSQCTFLSEYLSAVKTQYIAPLHVGLIFTALVLTARAVLALPQTCCHTISRPPLDPCASAVQNKSKGGGTKNHILRNTVFEKKQERVVQKITECWNLNGVLSMAMLRAPRFLHACSPHQCHSTVVSAGLATTAMNFPLQLLLPVQTHHPCSLTKQAGRQKTPQKQRKKRDQLLESSIKPSRLTCSRTEMVISALTFLCLTNPKRRRV